jgi:hypothetical protein
VSEDFSRTVRLQQSRHFLRHADPMLARHPVASPAAIERMNAMIGVLRRTGLDEQTTLSAYEAPHTYTVSFAALEASRTDRTSGRNQVRGLAWQLAPYTTAPLFNAGLGYLLKGIGRQPTQTENPACDRERWPP